MRLPRLRTIRARVALATLVAFSAILCVSAEVIDDANEHTTSRALDDRMKSEAETLAALTRFDGRRVLVDFDDETITSFGTPRGGAYFQVATAQGEVVERSHSLETASLPLPPSVPPLASPRDRRFEWSRVHDPFTRERARLVTLVLSRAAAASGRDEEPGAGVPRATVVIQVVRSLAEVERARHATRRALAITLPLALVLGTVAAFVVAGRATAPVARLGQQARAIGDGALGARLDVGELDGELADLARTLNQAFDRLGAAADRERRFAADAAHELRTPVAIARTAAELALSRERDPEEYREALRTVVASTRRLEELISSLLLLARAEQAAFPRAPVDLRSSIVEGVDATKALATERGQSLRLNLPDEELPVSGNASLLARLVANLVENGLRHGASPEGVQVSATATGGAAELVVVDRGGGFTAALEPRLFERFARADESRARETGGTGLGLALVRAIARAHGGEARARTREGGGAEVRVSIPLCLGPPAAVEEESDLTS